MTEETFRTQQRDARFAPHVAPINRYVDEIRNAGRGWAPYVAPIHGGTEARVLSILRDPGPATQDEGGSGFLCIENNDGSAEFQAQRLEEVGLIPHDLLPWNAYPWYINRAPKAAELKEGMPTIVHLLSLAPQIRVVLLQGLDAQKAWRRVRTHVPGLEADRGLTTVETYHPSPQALFVRDLDERERRRRRRLEAFAEVAAILGTEP